MHSVDSVTHVFILFNDLCILFLNNNSNDMFMLLFCIQEIFVFVILFVHTTRYQMSANSKSKTCWSIIYSCYWLCCNSAHPFI